MWKQKPSILSSPPRAKCAPLLRFRAPLTVGARRAANSGVAKARPGGNCFWQASFSARARARPRVVYGEQFGGRQTAARRRLPKFFGEGREGPLSAPPRNRGRHGASEPGQAHLARPPRNPPAQFSTGLLPVRSQQAKAQRAISPLDFATVSLARQVCLRRRSPGISPRPGKRRLRGWPDTPERPRPES